MGNVRSRPSWHELHDSLKSPGLPMLGTTPCPGPNLTAKFQQRLLEETGRGFRQVLMTGAGKKTSFPCDEIWLKRA